MNCPKGHFWRWDVSLFLKKYLQCLRKCFITTNFSTGVVKIIVITTNISLIIFHLWCGNISLLSYSRSETFPYYLVFLVTFLFWFGNCSLLFWDSVMQHPWNMLKNHILIHPNICIFSRVTYTVQCVLQSKPCFQTQFKNNLLARFFILEINLKIVIITETCCYIVTALSTKYFWPCVGGGGVGCINTLATWEMFRILTTWTRLREVS